MGCVVDETGFGVIFGHSIPDFITEKFAVVTDSALQAANLKLEQIDRYVCHPGGALQPSKLRCVLSRAHCKLSAPRCVMQETSLCQLSFYVMKSLLDAGQQGQMMACAVGPGFTASYLPFHISAEAT